MTQITVDAQTLAYLELISGKKGDAAVKAWLLFSFTSYGSDDYIKTQNGQMVERLRSFPRRKVSVEDQLLRAKAKAQKHFNRSMETT